MLSIVIPVYNGKKYIPKLLDCFKAQTASYFELVFVDDGSTDGSYEALQSLSAIYKDSFAMKVIHQENSGVSSARNTGIANCSGDYITFVDMDDYIVPEYFEEVFKGIKTNPDLFVFQSAHVDESDLIDFKEGAASISKNKNISNVDLIKTMLHNPTNFGVYNLVINRNFLDKSGVIFPEGYNYYEDYFYIYSLFCHAKTIVFTKSQLYYYVKRPNSAMQKFTKDRIKCIELIESLCPLIEKTVPGIYEDFKSASVSRIYWSALWQSALSFKTYRDFRKFYLSTNAKERLQALKAFKGLKVKLSTNLFFASPLVYYLAVNLLGRSHSKVGKITFADYE